jgi:hypothetical protein
VPQLVALLDCNALNYLVKPPVALADTVRRGGPELRRAVRERQLLCIASPYVIGQVGATVIRDAVKAREMLALLRELSRGWIMWDRPQRIDRERVARRSLDVFDVCVERHREDYTWDWLDKRLETDPRIRRALCLEIARGRRAADHYSELIDPVREKLGGTGVATKELDKYFDSDEADPGRWVADFLQRSRHGQKLAREGGVWPDARELPSVWNYVAYLLSYIHLVNTRRISPHPGDHGDVALYSEAAYVDVLVTDDGNMARIVSNIRGAQVPTQRLSDFLARW